jgi:hypothetical protein
VSAQLERTLAISSMHNSRQRSSRV